MVPARYDDAGVLQPLEYEGSAMLRGLASAHTLALINDAGQVRTVDLPW
jgi:hypothetical protein